MKAKVIIENGETTIVLTPENAFETAVIERVKNNREPHNVLTHFEAEYSFGAWKNHHITLSIKEER